MDFDSDQKVLAALEREQVDYVVFDAVAININLLGLPRATEDLDIFIAPHAVNVERLKTALRSVFMDPSIEEITAEDLLGDYPAVQYVPPEGTFYIEILTRIGEAFRYEDVTSLRLDFGGLAVNVATPEALYRRAAAYFEQSISNDPGFARAHAQLATVLAADPSHRRENAARAKAAALKAIELAPKLADAHHQLASIYMYEDWNWSAAGDEFERAARLAPDSAAIHHSYAGYFSTLGQHGRALDEMQQALRLDPVSVAVGADTGWYWFVARRYDEAIAQSKKALELDAQHRGAHYYVLLALLAKGDAAEAREWAAKYLALLGGTPEEIARVTSAEPSAGLRAFWQIRLAHPRERAQTEPVPAQEFALLYASLGDTENAQAYLDRAYEEHSGWLLPFMRVYPPLDALRTHARFLDLQSKMHFPGPSGSAGR